MSVLSEESEWTV